MSQALKLRYHVKGLVPRNTHVQYESLIISGKKVMVKVKVLFTHTHRRGHQGHDFSSPDIPGSFKINSNPQFGTKNLSYQYKADNWAMIRYWIYNIKNMQVNLVNISRRNREVK